MGIYLSTPSVEVFAEIGEGNNVAYAAGEMQGWRKNMEDGHIAVANFNTLLGENYRELPEMSLFGVFDGHGGKEVAKFVKLKYNEMLANLDSFKSKNYEDALRDSFHRIDIMLEDHQYDKILRHLRALPNPSDTERTAQRNLTIGKYIPRLTLITPDTDPDLKALSEDDMDSDNEEGGETGNEADGGAEIAMLAKLLKSGGIGTGGENEEDGDEGDKRTINTSEAVDLIANFLQKKIAKNEDKQLEDGKKDDSDESSDKLSGGEDNYPETVSVKAKPPVDENQDDESEEPRVAGKSKTLTGLLSLDLSEDGSVDDGSGTVDREPPTIHTHSGPVCNLKGHRVLAGCTAIVTLRVGNKLITANAGDSRGVLCREGGTAHALSYDHKPQAETEMNRIESAGGFVNFAGRINGNLNLSRSLGDLKYKQQKHIPPAGQIITAEPDISVVEIEPTDRFFVLACDGVWDCMTNQDICDFICARLDANDPPLSLQEIVRQVFEYCLSEDPRHTGGLGGDNMTCMIVLLNQDKKNFENKNLDTSHMSESQAKSEGKSNEQSDGADNKRVVNDGADSKTGSNHQTIDMSKMSKS